MENGKISTSAPNFTGSSFIEKAVNVLGDGICIVDDTAHLLYINQQFAELIHLRMGRWPVPGELVYSFMPAERQEKHRELLLKALDGENSVLEFLYTADNSDRWLRVEYYPMPNEDGHNAAVCIRAIEITESIALKKILDSEQRNRHKNIIKATIEAEEKQRSQIGRELHDNVNQVLTTIKLYAELCLRDELDNRSLLEQIVQRSNYCIEEIRALSRRLASPSIEEQSLEDLIQNLADSIMATQKIEIRFRSSGMKGKVLQQDIQTAIYRIAQEQFTNILKYAEATTVDIILVYIDNTVAMQIQDNGKGFDFSLVSPNSGLTNMVRRAETFGGTISFDTAPGRGCSITTEFRV